MSFEFNSIEEIAAILRRESRLSCSITRTERMREM